MILDGAFDSDLGPWYSPHASGRCSCVLALSAIKTDLLHGSHQSVPPAKSHGDHYSSNPICVEEMGGVELKATGRVRPKIEFPMPYFLIQSSHGPASDVRLRHYLLHNTEVRRLLAREKIVMLG